jgi:hypothetical protein
MGARNELHFMTLEETGRHELRSRWSPLDRLAASLHATPSAE